MISELIKTLRFPLMFCIVIIHVIAMTESYCFSGNSHWVYFLKVLSPFISLAVPLFFAISGYLFFNNAETFSATVYKKKLKSRMHSLVIPYFLWSSIFLFIKIILEAVSPEMLSAGLLSGGIFFVLKSFFVYAPNGTPLVSQFWFLRDLIFIVFFTPLLYFCFRKMRVFFLVLCSFFFIFADVLHFPDFILNYESYLYFFIFGAYFGIFKKDVLMFLNSKMAKFLTYLFFVVFCLKLFELEFLKFFLESRLVFLSVFFPEWFLFYA